MKWGMCPSVGGLDVGSSSSLTALATAVAYLRKGDCDTALVVTVSCRYAHRHLLMMQVRALSPSQLIHERHSSASPSPGAHALARSVLLRR